MSETYRETHPWITFTLDLQRVPWQFWLLAGEAASKCEHLAGAALDPETAQTLMQISLAKGALATTAIEGNTLTEEEALRRIDGKLTLPPSKEYLGVEIDNIVRACNETAHARLAGQPRPISPELILGFNDEVLKGLELDEGIVPGALRTYSVGVADYRGAPAADLDELLRRLCDWLNGPWLGEDVPGPQSDRQRLEAILKAVMAHLYLAWIHPFGDGNGRTARLVEFTLLVDGGVPLPAAHLLSNHYNQTRSEYYRQLRRASKSGGDVIPFLLYAVRGMVDQLREQIAVVRDRQLEIFWQHHLHRTLGDSETGRRRRYLVLDLAEVGRAVPRGKLADVSFRVARHYARRSDKTLARDIDELELLQLIRRTTGGYVANREIVQAYLPPAAVVEHSPADAGRDGV